MRRRRLILLGVFILVAAAMAYFLQDIVRAALFVPVSYLWWGFNIIYQSVAEIIYWILLVVGITLMAFGSLYGRESSKELVEEDVTPSQGPLAETANQISRMREGVYYKWLVANRMGKLARSILSLRRGQVDTSGSQLSGQDWNPVREVKSYLESGLARTFADYPRPNLLSRSVKTPFDIDLDQVIAYLESQMENHRD